jgi:hypothetical protein
MNEAASIHSAIDVGNPQAAEYLLPLDYDALRKRLAAHVAEVLTRPTPLRDK